MQSLTLLTKCFSEMEPSTKDCAHHLDTAMPQTDGAIVLMHIDQSVRLLEKRAQWIFGSQFLLRQESNENLTLSMSAVKLIPNLVGIIAKPRFFHRL